MTHEHYRDLTPLSDAEIAQHHAHIEQHGYCILEQAIEAPLLQALKHEIERLERVRPGGDIPPAPFTGFHTRRWFDLLNDDPIWQQVAIHPWALQILPDVLGDGFLLSTMGTAVIGPGEARQAIHCDDMLYGFPRPHPNICCNIMWAINDFTEANGATRVVPGSHNLAEDPSPRSRRSSTTPLD